MVSINKPMYYADIHMHILPGVDDGARDMQESLRMIEQSYDAGVRVMVATPHCGKVSRYYEEEEVIGKFEELKDICMVQAGPGGRLEGLMLYLGSELHVATEHCVGLVEELQMHPTMTIAGGRYVLLELPFDIGYSSMRQIIRNFVQIGYRPIVAHAERYICLRPQQGTVRRAVQRITGILRGGRREGGIGEVRVREADGILLEGVIEVGALIQFNAEALTEQDPWCLEMIRRGNVSFLASDCHDTEERAPNIDIAAHVLYDMFEEEDADEMLRGFLHNALDMLGIEHES